MKLLRFEEYEHLVNEIFEKLLKEVRAILPNARIEHIGSSSIPNSISKGDLDVFVGVPKPDLEKAVNLIKDLEFAEKENTFRSDELCMLTTNKFNYDVAIQVVANNSDFEDFIKFRNALKGDPNLVNEYNNIKFKAQNLSNTEYRKMKSQFIDFVLKGI